jgi:hypothetical protein
MISFRQQVKAEIRSSSCGCFFRELPGGARQQNRSGELALELQAEWAAVWVESFVGKGF